MISAPIVSLETLEAKDQAEWYSWLRRNHLSSQGVWLVFYRKGTGGFSPTYEEALDWALAYGWIDSLIRKIDDRKYVRKFTPRKPWSIWSTPNINRVKRLDKEGKMTSWGMDSFAKRTSEKSLLEQFKQKEVEMPEDLKQALRKNPTAWSNFQKFSPGYRKRYLMWISGAKKTESRKKRIAEAVELISQNVKALLK